MKEQIQYPEPDSRRRSYTKLQLKENQNKNTKCDKDEKEGKKYVVYICNVLYIVFVLLVKCRQNGPPKLIFPYNYCHVSSLHQTSAALNICAYKNLTTFLAVALNDFPFLSLTLTAQTNTCTFWHISNVCFIQFLVPLHSGSV